MENIKKKKPYQNFLLPHLSVDILYLWNSKKPHKWHRSTHKSFCDFFFLTNNRLTSSWRDLWITSFLPSMCSIKKIIYKYLHRHFHLTTVHSVQWNKLTSQANDYLAHTAHWYWGKRSLGRWQTTHNFRQEVYAPSFPRASRWRCSAAGTTAGLRWWPVIGQFLHINI